MKHLKIAATADGGIVIEGYGVPFGGPIKGRDLHGQFFSKKTDFALDLIPDGQRPLLFQHGLDSSVDTAVIGRWGVKRIDDGGVWVRAQLDARSEYINEIKELVDSDALGFSSGTMGHLVKVAPKTGEILKWALVELSLTPNPANPNAYIVRGNKSASAHVKSLFATKHGDHDQSEHGNWATGGGSDKGEDKDKTVHDAYARREHNAQEARAEAKQGIDKAYEKSGLSRPGYLPALPEPGMTDKQAFDHGYKEGTAKPTLSYQDDRIRTTGELMQALGLWKAINEQDPLGGAGGDMNGREWLSATAATSAESDRAAADIHEDNNWHNSAAVLRAVAEGKEWLETHDYGKKSLKVKRSVKHGDHDQSEHGNWATGGGADKEDRGARDTNRAESERRSTGAWQEKFGKVGEYHASGEAVEMAKDLVSMSDYREGSTSADRNVLYAGNVVDNVFHLASQWNSGEPLTAINMVSGAEETMTGSATVEEALNKIAGQGDAFAHQSEDNYGRLQAEAEAALAQQVLNDLRGGSSDGPDDKFNDYMSGYEVPGYPKTFRVKRSTKHGDHDQSEHGNWSNGTNPVADKRKEISNRYWDEAKEDANKLAAAIANRGSWNDETNKVLKESMRLIKQGLGDGDYRTVLEAAKEALDLDQIRSAYNNPRSTAVNGFLNNVYAATDNAYRYARLADLEISKKP
jgi:hypothetical protein